MDSTTAATWPTEKWPVWSLRAQKTKPAKRIAQVLVGVIALCLVVSAFWHPKVRERIRGSLSNPWAVEENPVYNATLGFERFYGIVMPGRHDRRDALLGAANATNLTLSLIDGVEDSSVQLADIPNGWLEPDGSDSHWAGQLGCLMSHINIWKMMITFNISTALIVESDADWDMRIKDSMYGLAEASQALMDFPFQPEVHQIGETYQHPRSFRQSPFIDAPYGMGWDALYVGTCDTKPDNEGRVWAYNDSAASPPEHTSGFNGEPDPEKFERHGTTRLVYHPSWVGCTVGYAISNAGARKLLDTYLNDNKLAIDMVMKDACVSDPNVHCLAMFPPMIAQAPSESNMFHDHIDKDEEEINAGHSIHISARVNAHNGLAQLGPEHWKKEWDD